MQNNLEESHCLPWLREPTQRQLTQNNGEKMKTLILWIFGLQWAFIRAALPTSGGSGIYYDNGLGQTVAEPMQAEAEAMKKLQEEILNLLGMKHVPSTSSPHFVSHLQSNNNEKSTVT